MRGDKCLPCDPGHASPVGLCYPCEGSTVADAKGGSCVACSPGSIPDAAHVACTPCPLGLIGVGCSECADGWYRLRVGGRVANASYDEGGGECHRCPPGGVCPGGPIGPVLTDHHSYVGVDGNVGTARVFRCFDTSCDFREGRPEQGFACASIDSGGDDDCCNVGRTGPLCERCKDGCLSLRAKGPRDPGTQKLFLGPGILVNFPPQFSRSHVKISMEILPGGARGKFPGKFGKKFGNL
jgi:hypothetical protein